MSVNILLVFPCMLVGAAVAVAALGFVLALAALRRRSPWPAIVGLGLLVVGLVAGGLAVGSVALRLIPETMVSCRTAPVADKLYVVESTNMLGVPTGIVGRQNTNEHLLRAVLAYQLSGRYFFFRDGIRGYGWIDTETGAMQSGKTEADLRRLATPAALELLPIAELCSRERCQPCLTWQP